MEDSLLGFLEMFIVFGFVIGWGILELVGLHLDKKRAAAKQASDAETSDDAEPDAGPS